MNVMTLSVKDIMTKKHLITGTESTTLLELADMTSKTGIQRIPIVDGEMKLIGLVTQSVLIRSFRALFEQPPS
jgi:CBS domain-containing protein